MSEFIIDSEGRKRRAINKQCVLCQKPYLVAERFQNKSQYCSKECVNKARDSKVQLTCAFCKSLFSKKQSKINQVKHDWHYCSRLCKDSAQRIDSGIGVKPPHYDNGQSVYRSRAIRHFGAECNRCKYNTYVEMLDVHHKDGNRSNNLIDNLEVLCVWCHALDTRKIPQHNR
jgi:hypothetical protein